MELTQADHELIASFLNDEISTAQKTAFLNRLETDPEFARHFHEYKEMHEALQVDVLALREKLQTVIVNGKTNATRSKFTYYKITASVVLLIAVAWLLTNYLPSASLFDQYYQVYLSEPVKRGGPQKAEAIRLYDAGKYQQAVKELQGILNNHNLTPEETDQYWLYAGNCYLNTHQINEAVQAFEKVDKSSTRYEFAQWYLALTFLKAAQKDETIQILENIGPMNGVYQEKSHELLKKLKE